MNFGKYLLFQNTRQAWKPVECLTPTSCFCPQHWPFLFCLWGELIQQEFENLDTWSETLVQLQFVQSAIWFEWCYMLGQLDKKCAYLISGANMLQLLLNSAFFLCSLAHLLVQRLLAHSTGKSESNPWFFSLPTFPLEAMSQIYQTYHKSFC